MKNKIDKYQLRKLVLDGISSEKLNSKYDYSEITEMEYLFIDCEDLEKIPHLYTSNVKHMRYMFFNCKKLTSISFLDTSNVTSNFDMNSMFSNCPNLLVDPFDFPMYSFNMDEHPRIAKAYPEYFT